MWPIESNDSPLLPRRMFHLFSPQFLFKAVVALVGVEAPPCLETTRRHPHRRSNRPGS